ncbi:MAG: hypothetical protein K2L54_01875, partial [Clostridiales bacterium]|nr:hypothetical protein [Clostridiales bacterium]
MKIRAKTSAVMIAMIMACVALLTACGKAAFYEKTEYPASDVAIVSPEETIDEITGDTSCEINDEPNEFYNDDNAPDDVKKDVADAPEAELPSVPDKIIYDVSTDTETPSDDASGANTVTIEYRATYG